jgi:RimJ/RimL family protein N-acetyltransferase
MGDVMSIEEKIINYLKLQKFIKNANLSEINTTSCQNKEGSKLLYVRASVLEKKLGTNYSNNSIYYAFDTNGNYVGCVKVSVLNVIPPNQIEMEYWANEQYKNRGNMTVLAQEVIRDIFESKSFDDLKVRDGIPTSKIETIMVAINDDNLASLAVASKIGFDKTGHLHIEDYCRNKEVKSPINL